MREDAFWLKIEYRIPAGIDRELDNIFITLLKKLGWTWWGGGLDLETGVRDIEFERD